MIQPTMKVTASTYHHIQNPNLQVRNFVDGWLYYREYTQVNFELMVFSVRLTYVQVSLAASLFKATNPLL